MKPGNPFTLTFGKKPNEYIVRYEAIETITSTFMAENPVSQTFLVEGLRGSGKTVLMTAIANELRNEPDWVVADLNSTHDLIDDLAFRLSETCRKIPDIRETGFNISFAGFGVGMNGAKTPHDNIRLIDTIFESLKKRSKRILITIDEVQNDKNMRLFASEFQLFLRKDYPVFLLMTGLYENIHLIQNDPALTFLLRTPKVCLEPLSLSQITKQYRSVFEIDNAEAKKLAMITKGYAFAFQALGMLYFEYRDELSLPSIIDKMEDMLDDFVYAKVWTTLSLQEKVILRNMPDRPIRVKSICEAVGMSSSVFSQYRDRLIKKGLIVSPGHGYLEPALPRFTEVVQNYGE